MKNLQDQEARSAYFMQLIDQNKGKIKTSKWLEHTEGTLGGKDQWRMKGASKPSVRSSLTLQVKALKHNSAVLKEGAAMIRIIF